MIPMSEDYERPKPVADEHGVVEKDYAVCANRPRFADLHDIHEELIPDEGVTFRKRI